MRHSATRNPSSARPVWKGRCVPTPRVFRAGGRFRSEVLVTSGLGSRRVEQVGQSESRWW
jgi:hypothetical protein